MVRNWYTRNGISTSQFFDNDSTESGTDEMMDDFAHRALQKMEDLEKKKLEQRSLIEKIRMNLDSVKGDNVILNQLCDLCEKHLKK